MLEIILIIALVRRNGRICKEKNIKPGWYQALTVVLWLAFEIIGAMIGAFLFPYERLMAYLFALMGAGLGALISAIIVNNLEAKKKESDSLLDSGLTPENFR